MPQLFVARVNEMAEFELFQILDTLTRRNYHVVEYCHSQGWTVLMPGAGKFIYAGKFICFRGIWVANKRWLRMAIKSAISLKQIETPAEGEQLAQVRRTFNSAGS